MPKDIKENNGKKSGRTKTDGGDQAELFARWRKFKKDPQAVEPQWCRFFNSMEADPKRPVEPGGSAVLDALRAQRLIAAYRDRGHLRADLDPLGLHRSPAAPELSPEFYGFLSQDYRRPISLDGTFGLQQASLTRILEILNRAYCQTLTLEYTHIQEPTERQWLKERMESCFPESRFSNTGKRAILQAVVRAEEFEGFLQEQFPNSKRFGLEGGEALIPAVEQILKRGQKLGLREMVIGMAHRGRLNVLANVMKKPTPYIFAEFRGQETRHHTADGSGDIKYHLGTSADRVFESGEPVHLSLAPNPSHLEVVNPVVLGRVRARQLQLMRKEDDGNHPSQDFWQIPRHKVMALLIHGDAAYAGQGIVMETFDLSQLRGYRCGGAIHIIINNQIGFTTLPGDARSSPYCSDVAKGIMAPVFHVNGNDPEAVVQAARLAVEYRQRFGKDVVIDMFCYRRHGHDEMEDASITQPMMYRRIGSTESVSAIYGERLVAEKVINRSRRGGMQRQERATLSKNFKRNDWKPPPIDWLKREWKGIKPSGARMDNPPTGVNADTLVKLAKNIFTLPKGFAAHKIVEYPGKKWAVENKKFLSWSTAELLAFASLLDEGYSVRLSGEDSGRGTFAQRHATVVNQKNGDKISPLVWVNPRATCEIVNSPLSEAGVLGFEYGFSCAAPHTLVMWEAQYGDFVNGAQVIIDQFISSGEEKWHRLSGLVMLLPHGYEGQGAEHSSGRPERFLWASAEQNWQVTMCSTPANHFHALRRQMHSKTRKVLVALTPKGRQKPKEYAEGYAKDKKNPQFYCVSPFEDFCHGSFQPLLDDPLPPPETNRVILCSGKIYFELTKARPKNHPTRLVRLEMLYPLPKRELKRLVTAHKNAEFCWLQEEPQNMGAAAWLKPQMEELLPKGRRLRIITRPDGAAPATGFIKDHQKQQAALLEEAFE